MVHPYLSILACQNNIFKRKSLRKGTPQNTEPTVILSCVFVCVHICVITHMYTAVCTSVCMCMWEVRGHLGCHSSGAIYLVFLRQGLSVALGDHQGG